MSATGLLFSLAPSPRHDAVVGHAAAGAGIGDDGADACTIPRAASTSHPKNSGRGRVAGRPALSGHLQRMRKETQ